MTAPAAETAGEGAGSRYWLTVPGQYDRREISGPERAALRELGMDLLRRHGYRDDAQLWQPVRRLLQPLDDAPGVLEWQPSALCQHERAATDAVGLVLARGGQLVVAYWQWTGAD
jgi:hypothetical protein